MRKQIILALASSLLAGALTAQVVPNLDWANNLPEKDSQENVPQAIDQNGNVYTIGYSLQSGNRNTTLQKIDPNGTTLWIKHFNGVGNADDKALAIALDNSGNIFICGETFNGSNKDFVTIKYDASGNQLWAKVFNGAGNGDDIANSITVDNGGEVYVGGRTTNAAGNFDLGIIKYNAAGTQQWVNTYNGSANGDDRLRGIVVSQNNRVFVTGYATSVSGGRDIVTRRINANNGASNWTQTFNGLANLDDEANVILLDGNDPVIGGSMINAGINKNYYVAKLNGNNGSITWNNNYDGYGNDDQITAMVLDVTGNLAATGLAYNGSTYEYHTVFYNASGAQQWVNKYNTGIATPIVTPKIARDVIANHFYVCGETAMGVPNTDALLYQITPGGNQIWTQTYNGSGNATDVAVDLTLNFFGQIYVAAQTGNTALKVDMTTLKYSQTPVYFPPDLHAQAKDPQFMFYSNLGQIVNTDTIVETSFNHYTHWTTPEIYVGKTSYSYVFRNIDTNMATIDTLERIEIKFAETGGNSQAFHFEEGTGVLNYFLAHCPNGITNVKGYYRLMVPNIFPNIDLHYYSNKDGLKYYFVLKPGANPAYLKLAIQGGTADNLNGNGDLYIDGLVDDITLDRPLAYQVNITGTPVALTGSANWIQTASHAYEISLPNYNSNLPLVVMIANNPNPPSAPPASQLNLDYSSFVGNSNRDEIRDIKVDANNSRYVTGITGSPTFPVLNEVQFNYSGALDGVIQKYTSNDSLRFSTFLGGSNVEISYSIDIKSTGEIYLAGATRSVDFPVKPKSGASNQLQHDISQGSNLDGFLTQLSNDGDTIYWSRYVGGSKDDEVRAIDIDETSNQFYFTGYTLSSDYVLNPATGQVTGTLIGANAAGETIGRYDSGDSLLLVQLFGGAANTSQVPWDIMVSDSAFLYTCGYRNYGTSYNNSVANQNSNPYMDNSLNGSTDGYFVRLDKTNMLPRWWTNFGGNGTEQIWKMDEASNGDIYFAGQAGSDVNFPVKQKTGAVYFDSTQNLSTAFIGHFDKKLNQVWTTFLHNGGNGLSTSALSIEIDASDRIYVGCKTNSSFLSYGASGNLSYFFDDNVVLNNDGFITIFDNAGQILHSTYFGGSFADEIWSMDTYQSQDLYCVGNTMSSDYQYAYTSVNQTLIDSTFGGGTLADGFIARFNLLSGFAVGLSELKGQTSSLICYPNPVVDLVTIKTDGIKFNFLNLVVYDGLGRQVYKKTYNQTEQNLTVDFSGFASGQYIIQLTTDELVKSMKLIKQ